MKKEVLGVKPLWLVADERIKELSKYIIRLADKQGKTSSEIRRIGKIAQEITVMKEVAETALVWKQLEARENGE